MTLKSMTGFARCDGSSGALSFYWEVRSVNGRGLDVRLRLPPGYEAIEAKARDLVAQKLARGSVTAALSVARDTRGTRIVLNETALEQVLAAAQRVRERTDGEPPRPEGLLAIRGVLEIVEHSESEAPGEDEREAILACLKAAIDDVAAARAAEGARLGAVLETQMAEVERLLAIVEAAPARRPEAIKARLSEQIARLIGGPHGLDPARLHQEAMLLATRADVAEELQRLASHVRAVRDLMTESGAVGRKLDFLAQEFNREANTLCSKSNDAEVTKAGLALKAMIDQLREQVQNVE